MGISALAMFYTVRELHISVSSLRMGPEVPECSQLRAMPCTSYLCISSTGRGSALPTHHLSLLPYSGRKHKKLLRDEKEFLKRKAR